MKSTRCALAIGLVITMAAAVGCSSDGGGNGSAGGVPQTPVIVSPTTITSGSTSVNIGTGELPSDFPDSFPLPDGATPVNSVSGAGGTFVWFASDQSVDDLRSFFDENLSSNGWKIDNKTTVSGADGEYSVYVIHGNGATGGVYLGAGAPGSDAYAGQYAFYVALTPA